MTAMPKTASQPTASHTTRTRTVAAFGVAVDVPTAWECRILRRSKNAENADTADQTHAVVHLANFPLPEQRDDFGGGVTQAMGASDVFVVLFEYGPESLGKRLFALAGVPKLSAEMFSPRGLQRPLAGQVGCQRFFTANERPFCLYVVAGGTAALPELTAQVNQALAFLEIARVETPG
ncbi:MAG: hypothetical protein QOH10_2854 [Actinomycetota bacterium]|nr:hypothetical protein [Actinomycetota bacterium]